MEAVSGRNDAVLVTIAINGHPRAFAAIARRARLPGAVLVDPRNRAVRAFRVNAVPSTFILDGAGHATKRFIGGYHKADFVRALDAVK